MLGSVTATHPRWRAALAPVLALVLLVGAACGESTGSKPSVGALEERLIAEGAPSSQANCIARALHSNLDDPTLNAILDADMADPLDALGELDGEMSERFNANQALTLAKAMASCVGLDPDSISPGLGDP